MWDRTVLPLRELVNSKSTLRDQAHTAARVAALATLPNRDQTPKPESWHACSVSGCRIQIRVPHPIPVQSSRVRFGTTR